MVGDRVNIASRAQATAEPGTVLVDETTRQATAAAIAFEDAGEHAVKGKAEPLRLLPGPAGGRRHRRVPVAARRSRRRSSVAPPSCAWSRTSSTPRSTAASPGWSGSRARRVSARRGSASELSNYVDGLAYDVLWHSGRCLSFGDGVAYWALAEIVRQRLGVAEDASEDEAAPGSPRASIAGSPIRTSATPLVDPRWGRCSGSPSPASSAQSCSRHGGCSSSASPSITRSRCCSKTCNGRTRSCSTSSRGCSSGRPSTRSSSAPSPDPSSPSAGPAGRPGSPTRLRCCSRRSAPDGDRRAARGAGHPAGRRRCAGSSPG